MADEEQGDPTPFDVQTIKQLVALMTRHDLSEIDLRRGDSRIRLCRGHPTSTVDHPTAFAAPPAPTPTAIVPSTTSPTKAAEPAPPARNLIEIKSPMVGTFYDREKPDANPYVGKGTRVTPTTTVGLIEAMKLFNEIQAECGGVIVEILVDNAQPVDYGTVLFRVDPS